MNFLDNKIKWKTLLKVSLISFLPLLITACGPALIANRSGNEITVAYDNEKSCFTLDHFRAVAAQECRKIGKSIAPVPTQVSNSTNVFCSSTGVWRTKFNCEDDLTGRQNSEPSRLELRAMQTRKFAKSPQTVAIAINELYKDKNQQCLGVQAPTYACPSGVSVSKVINGKPTTYCANSDGTPAAEQKLIKHAALSPDGFCMGAGYKTTFAIDTNYPESSTTTLRVRVSNYRPGSPTETQSTNPAVYNKIFKEIADGLFIDAIELTPTEMQ